MTRYLIDGISYTEHGCGVLYGVLETTQNKSEVQELVDLLQDLEEEFFKIRKSFQPSRIHKEQIEIMKSIVKAFEDKLNTNKSITQKEYEVLQQGLVCIHQGLDELLKSSNVR